MHRCATTVQWSDYTCASASCVFVRPAHGGLKLFLCLMGASVKLSVRQRLTSLSWTFALNVHMAPLPVLFEGAALLVAATAVVALEGLLHCGQEF